METTEKTEKTEKKQKTISAKSMIIPVTIAMLLMHLLIVFNTVRINDMSGMISAATQQNFQLSGMSSGFSQLTDAIGGTAMNYVNGGREEELATYFEEQENIGGSYHAMLALIERQDPPEDTGRKLTPQASAAGNANPGALLGEAYNAVMRRAETEMTAMAIAARARGAKLDDYPRLQTRETPTELERLPAEARLTRAREKLLDSAYQSTRGDVQRNLSIAISMTSNAIAARIQQYSARLAVFRMEQWVLMGAIILAMLVMIVLLFTRLLLPLEKSVDLVQREELLPTGNGFSELRRLARSYDELLTHRNELEEDLRKRSYTDALTGLPNRMAYQEYIKKLERLPAGTSLIAYSMDVNGLKGTNDGHGHRYGDILLRDSAACILKVFGNETGKNVFRIGGDEFAAFCLNGTEEDARKALENFQEEQARYGIGISVGYTWAPNVRGENIPHMIEAADKRMYSDKAARKLAASI